MKLKLSDESISSLGAELGPDGVLTGDDVSNRPSGIWRSEGIAAPVIFRPANTEEVATVLRACNAAGQPVITHGGLTGLVKGAITTEQDVVLSTERLNAIESLSVVDRTMLVQAGVKLEQAQDRAESDGLMLALDMGARGSCTLGGNAATNAGGNRVIRYGMTRDNVLGLEAVLADGTVVSSLNGMLKNNAGYDLKQLFIGSEGTLGVITRLMLRLRPAWRSQNTALVACRDFTAVTKLLQALDESLGGTLSAFEVLWQNYYELVAGDNPPLAADYPYYILVEALGADIAADHERFLGAISAAIDNKLVADAVVCKSGAEREALWQLRDNVDRTMDCGPVFIFDVSLRLSHMEAYVDTVLERLRIEWDGSDYHVWVFGHAGDGNLHFVCAMGDREQATRDRVERAVYEPLAQISGSISGEHGIGLEKKRWLPTSRTPEEIALMQRLKQTLDPGGILNPNRVFDLGGADEHG
ncbi:MAG: FAD-binding oxidoreductase [Gammaproteobacteria bacterium]|jgi:FAD/FMN-containing dehydrogenase|nr:FAD-binding oxidoreductase [Gammaproteobacteria bacterium]MDP6617266.1 FAD-binding oxidoreductase [Gammaproteobacteria bacterium]MDP6694044.1 FAD-binding oxidoreductase [Gammaproteobacteria bacterium]